MTLTSTTTSVSYSGNGSTSSFSIPFLFLENSHIKATLTDSSGTDTVWTLGTEYSLTGAGEAAGGTLTAGTSPTDYRPDTGETLTIERVTPLTQDTSLPLGGPLPSTSVERMVDKAVMNVQETAQTIARSIRFPVTDSVTLSGELEGASTRASKFLAFDADGEPIAAAGTSADLGPVSSFIDTLLDDTDAATARTTLGAEKLSITTRGDLIRGSSAGVAERLALGSDGEVIGSDGTDLGYLPHPGLASVQVFTASDTWTRPAGVRMVLVKVIGGGGGGGSADSGGAALSGAGGGASGGMAVKLIDVTGISSSTITIGAAGAAGVGEGGGGGTGGDSIWSDGTNTITGAGGGGGAGSGSAPAVDRGYEGGAGNASTGGDVNTVGSDGNFGWANTDMAQGGTGGASPFGGGGRGGRVAGSNGTAAGSAGGAYGGGGGGGANRNSSSPATGADGAAGVVIVWEYK